MDPDFTVFRRYRSSPLPFSLLSPPFLSPFFTASRSRGRFALSAPSFRRHILRARLDMFVAAGNDSRESEREVFAFNAARSTWVKLLDETEVLLSACGRFYCLRHTYVTMFTADRSSTIFRDSFRSFRRSRKSAAKKIYPFDFPSCDHLEPILERREKKKEKKRETNRNHDRHARCIANPRDPLTCITRRRKLEFARIQEGWSSVDVETRGSSKWELTGPQDASIAGSRGEEAGRLSLSLARAARPARPSFNSG